MTVLQLVLAAAPEEEDVVAGWTAFGLFGLGVLAVALLGFSLVKRLKNVERAAEAGLYDPSTPKPERGAGRPPARGLAAHRQMLRDQAEAEAARDRES